MSRLTFTERVSDPAPPGANQWTIYTKGAGFFIIDDTGAVTGPFGAAGGLTHTVDDTVNAASSTAVALRHTLSSGSPLAGFGIDMALELVNSAAAIVEAGRLLVQWDNPLSGSEESTVILSAMTAGTLAEMLRLEGGNGNRLVRARTNDDAGRVGGLWSDFISADSTLVKDIMVILARTSAGGAGVGMGGRLAFKGHNSAKTEIDMGGMFLDWADPAAGAEAARLVFQRRNVLGGLHDALTIEGIGVKFHDPADPTKKWAFDGSAIAAATQRVLTMPNQDIDLTPGVTFPLAQATETVKGGAEIATLAEALAGTDDTRMITPLKMLATLSDPLRNTPGLKNFVSRLNSTSATNATTNDVLHGFAVSVVNPFAINRLFLCFVQWTWRHDNMTTDFIGHPTFGGLEFGDPIVTRFHQQEPTDPGANQRHTSIAMGLFSAAPGANSLAMFFRSSSAVASIAQCLTSYLCAFQVD